jgi:hypothetical protein
MVSNVSGQDGGPKTLGINRPITCRNTLYERRQTERIWKKAAVTLSRYCTNICLKQREKPRETSGQSVCRPGLEPRNPQYVFTALPPGLYQRTRRHIPQYLTFILTTAITLDVTQTSHNSDFACTN